MIINLDMSKAYNYILCILMIAVGVYFLIKCSDIFVDSASFFAKKLKIPSIIIGLTIVAFGTSLPELAVSASDSIACLINGGNANIAIGNVVGSNIANILLVLGSSALFTPIILKRGAIRYDYPIMLSICLLGSLLILLFPLNNTFAILRWEGVIRLAGIIADGTYLIIVAKRKMKTNPINEIESPTPDKYKNAWMAVLFLLLGLAGIVVGGELVVTAAKSVAIGIGDLAGLNHDLVESLVGLTIVAVGTSLPELVTSIVAAKKGENEIAFGNVIGSNIFNILFILGIGSVINPLTIGSQIIVDLAVMIAAVVLAFVLSLKKKLTKRDGLIFILCYTTYIIYLILRTVL